MCSSDLFDGTVDTDGTVMGTVIHDLPKGALSFTLEGTTDRAMDLGWSGTMPSPEGMDVGFEGTFSGQME